MKVCETAHIKTISNIFLKSNGPIVTKFHIELPWALRRRVYSNSPGHMTNMAAMPVHGKKIKLFFCETSRPIALKFDK